MKLSVILPVHNGERYLEECADSLIAQSFADWECLCVDDGSTDRTLDVLNECARRDKRFVVIHKKNEGVSAARNVALDRARGEYVAFVDADDVLDHDWFAKAADVMNKHMPDLIRFDRVLWRHQEPLPCSHAATGENLITGKNAVAWGLKTFLRQGQSWLNFIRRDVIGTLRYPVELAVREDVVFLSELALKLNKVYEADYRGYFYRLHGDSAWHRVRQPSDAIGFPRAIVRLSSNIPADIREDVNVRRAYSQSVLANLEEWVVFADSCGRKKDGAVLSATSDAINTAVFDQSGLDLRMANLMFSALEKHSLVKFARVMWWRWRIAQCRHWAKKFLWRGE